MYEFITQVFGFIAALAVMFICKMCLTNFMFVIINSREISVVPPVMVTKKFKS